MRLNWILGFGALLVMLLCGATPPLAPIKPNNEMCMQMPNQGSTFDSCSVFVAPCNSPCEIVQGFAPASYLCLPANGWNCIHTTTFNLLVRSGSCWSTAEGMCFCWCTGPEVLASVWGC